LRADSIDLGMSIFEDLSRKERYFDQSSMIQLKIADGKRLKGMIKEAESEYLDVIEQFPKTNQSAEAYYRLGLIYQYNKDDLETAKKYYNDATKEKRNSEFYSLALTKSAQISKLETYRLKLGRIKQDTIGSSDTLDPALTDDQTSQQDSLSTPTSDTLSADSQPDSSDNLAITNFQKSMAKINNDNPDTISEKSDTASQVSDSPDSLVQDTISFEEDSEIRFLLAELYHHDLNRPDSALNEYLGY